MKFVVLLVGMAIVAWLVATQLKTARIATTPGGPQGTPKQIIDQTQDRLKAAGALEQKQLDAAAKAANQAQP